MIALAYWTSFTSLLYGPQDIFSQKNSFHLKTFSNNFPGKLDALTLDYTTTLFNKIKM